LQEGKGLGYINLADSDLAQRLMKSIHDISGGRLVSVIVKHEMPSAVARGTDPFETYTASWHADPLSNFGGVVALSYEVTPEIAEAVVTPARNTEVLLAPSYTKEALEILKKREPLRVVKMPGVEGIVADNGLDYKRVEGGLLVENRFQTKIRSPEDIDCISEAKPIPGDIDAALLAWHTAAYTRSNAVVIGMQSRIHGIGSGQRSRIDAAYNAVRIATERGYGAQGTFMASDAFMPATDVVELCHNNGIRGIIYPLGSNKDAEVLDMANKYGMVMLITRKPGETQGGERCFLHR
jgi:phosphoribosylaminoimidazolecarboxamide formyltransferase/IMP cyclohydrolase